MYHVFTDGSCINNGKLNAIAGLGLIIFKENNNDFTEIFSLSERVNKFFVQSNNTGELSSIMNALKYFITHNLCDEEIIVYTDSKYCINSISDEGERWYLGWMKNDWKNSTKKEVMNKEIIQRILNQRALFSNLKFHYVKAHQKKPIIFENIVEELKWLGNDIADELAKKAIQI